MNICKEMTLSFNTLLFGRVQKEMREQLKGVHLFSSARQGLYFIYQWCRGNGFKILFPDYICRSVFDYFDGDNTAYDFYHIDDNLRIDVAGLKAKITDDTRFIYVIHYFGFVDPEFKDILQYAQELGLYIIEDCAIGMFSLYEGIPVGRHGQVGLFNYVKNLPLPNGGGIIINDDNLGDRLGIIVPDRYSKKKLVRKLILKLIYYCYIHFHVPFRFFRPLFEINNKFQETNREKKLFTPADMEKMSGFSFRYLEKLDPVEMTRSRRENFLYYLQKLRNHPQMHIVYPDIPEGICPFGFVILIKHRDRVRAQLLKFNIETAVLWEKHLLPDEVTATGNRQLDYLSQHILCLPVNEHITRKKIDYLIDKLSQLIANNEEFTDEKPSSYLC